MGVKRASSMHAYTKTIHESFGPPAQPAWLWSTATNASPKTSGNAVATSEANSTHEVIRSSPA